MEEQARDAFFDDLRSLARTVEKGRRDLQTALDSDAESTEQLDNLRSVFTGAKSLKVKLRYTCSSFLADSLWCVWLHSCDIELLLPTGFDVLFSLKIQQGVTAAKSLLVRIKSSPPSVPTSCSYSLLSTRQLESNCFA